MLSLIVPEKLLRNPKNELNVIINRSEIRIYPAHHA